MCTSSSPSTVRLRAGAVCESAAGHLEQLDTGVDQRASGCTCGTGANASCIARRLIWFHHILSTTKRKSIVAWGSELELGGYCVPGHPGVLICEGVLCSHETLSYDSIGLYRWARPDKNTIARPLDMPQQQRMTALYSCARTYAPTVGFSMAG